MGFIEGDGWWRKHGVTTTATIVEVGVPKQFNEAFWDQKVTADVKNPATGELVRLKSSLLSNVLHQVGQTMLVRFSPDRDYFRQYSNNTVPKEEWLRDQNAASPTFGGAPSAPATAPAGVQIVNASGADRATIVAQLEALQQQGRISAAQVEQAKAQLAGAAPTPPAPGGQIEDRLKRLQSLHEAGAIDDGEYARERARILESL